MNSQLRRIAIYVEEPTERNFVWVLNERDADDEWVELARAESGIPTYKDAMAEGLLKLQSDISDLNAGPRRAITAAKSNHRESSLTKAAVSDDPKHVGCSVFGFGPAN